MTNPKVSNQGLLKMRENARNNALNRPIKSFFRTFGRLAARGWLFF
jgi:hypothetical protein